MPLYLNEVQSFMLGIAVLLFGLIPLLIALLLMLLSTLGYPPARHWWLIAVKGIKPADAH